MHHNPLTAAGVFRRARITRVLWALLLLPALQCAAQDEHPYARVRAGDWAIRKITVDRGGTTTESTVRESVITAVGWEATLKVETESGGKTESEERKLSLDAVWPSPVPGGTAEKIDEEADQVAAGNHTYSCRMVHQRFVSEAEGKRVETEVRTWYSSDVRCGSVVKQEITSPESRTAVTLLDAGDADTPMPAPPAPATGPKPGEKINVEWKGEVYKAIVLKAENGKFLVHYDGYEDEWDEWIGPERIK